jgi:DNA-binding beta-propeller fold protein YncE
MRRLVAALLLASLCLLAQDAVLLVLHKGGSSLGFYTPQGKLLTTVPVGKHPHEMVLAPDGRLLYISDNGTMRIEEAGAGGNTVSIVDVVARKKVGEISLGKYHRPHGIDLDAKSGLLAVSTENPDALLIVDPAKRTVVKVYDTKGKTSHMVKFGADRARAFVCNSTSNDVAAIQLSSGAVKNIPVGERPEGSVLSRDGRELYVCCREGHKICIIDTAKQAVAGEITTGRGPVRVGLTPDGKRLVWALYHDEAIEIADPTARKVLNRLKLTGRLVSLNVSPDGQRAYASAEELDTVCVVSIAGAKLLQSFKTPAGYHPDPVLEFAAHR